MRYLYSLAVICTSFLLAASAQAGAWQDGAYLRWYPNDESGLSVEPLEKFAINFKPRVERRREGKHKWLECLDSSNTYNDEAARVLRQRIIDDQYRLYVSLAILKLYNCHYEAYSLSQGFDDKPQTLEGLNLVHGAYVKLLAQAGHSVENPLTFNIVNYLKDNPALLDNRHIQAGLRKTCKLAGDKGHKDKQAFCMKLLR